MTATALVNYTEPIVEVGPWQVKVMTLTPEKAKELWDIMQTYKTLFSDLTRNDFGNFLNVLLEKRTLWFEVWSMDNLVGVIWLTEMEQVIDATVHMVFFDRQPAEKKLVCRRMLQWVFSQYPLHRISVSIPQLYHATHRLVKSLGFTAEGTKREAVLIGGKWNDLLLYGMTRAELGEE